MCFTQIFAVDLVRHTTLIVIIHSIGFSDTMEIVVSAHVSTICKPTAKIIREMRSSLYGCFKSVKSHLNARHQRGWCM